MRPVALVPIWKRRLPRIAVAAIAIVGAGLAAYFAITDGSTPDGRASGRTGVGRHCPGVELGTVAFVRDSALAIVDFRQCKARILAPKGVDGPVQFSADGRYIAFNGGYVSSKGGTVHTTQGAGVWSPRADLLAASTAHSGVELVDTNGKTRALLPDRWGAMTFAFSPDGRTLAVSRSLYRGPSVPPPYHQEIWLVDVATGRRHMIFKQPRGTLAPAWLAGYSPDGRWLIFWEDTQNSASLAADGLPLMALKATGGRPIEIGEELHYRDFMTWCGSQLVYVINRGGRVVTNADGIAAAGPPSWRSQTILSAGGRTSWNSVACPTAAAVAWGGGGLAIAGGPSASNDMNVRLGSERRSIWLASPTKGTKPERLSETVPPKGETDELPMWSGDGRWIVFVRTKPGGIDGEGLLYAIDPFGGNLVGPIAAMGRTESYYGAYGWSNRIDWHR